MKLKKATADQKGLKKLPTAVRNKMGYMKEGGKLDPKKKALAPMKKKKAGQAHRDGARMVGNYKKGAADLRKEFKRVSDAEQHRQTSGSKPGKPRLAQELSSRRR